MESLWSCCGAAVELSSKSASYTCLHHPVLFLNYSVFYSMQQAFCSAFWVYFLLFWHISGCFCALSRDSDNCCTCTVEFSSVSDFGAN